MEPGNWNLGYTGLELEPGYTGLELEPDYTGLELEPGYTGLNWNLVIVV